MFFCIFLVEVFYSALKHARIEIELLNDFFKGLDLLHKLIFLIFGPFKFIFHRNMLEPYVLSEFNILCIHIIPDSSQQIVLILFFLLVFHDKLLLMSNFHLKFSYVFFKDATCSFLHNVICLILFSFESIFKNDYLRL